MSFSPVCLICFTTRRKICTQDTATATEVWFHSHIALLGDFTSWHALGISKQSPYREGICYISYMLNNISLSIYEWPDRRKHMQICHIWPVPINILIQYSILHFWRQKGINSAKLSCLMVQFSSQRYRSSTATRWLKSDRATAEKALVMNPNTTVPAPQFLIWCTSAKAQGWDLLITICSLHFLNLQRLLRRWSKTLWHFLMGHVAQLPFAPQTGWEGPCPPFRLCPISLHILVLR